MRKTLLVFVAAFMLLSCNDKEDPIVDNSSDIVEAGDEDEDVAEGKTDDETEKDVPEIDINDMTILGYWGVRETYASYDAYKEMLDCGINTSHARFSSLDKIEESLEICEELGMHLIPQGWSVFSADPEETVRRLEAYSSLKAYFIADEPTVDDLPDVVEKIRILQDAGATRPFYVNLNPYYSDNYYIRQGFSSYKEYVDAILDGIDPDFISFDFYPIQLSDGKYTIRSTWYDCMEVYREESIERDRPFWAFALSIPHMNYPQPTVEQVRLQLNVNLAYGAQGIEYFTYWLPAETDHDYHDSPIDGSGQKTDTWYVVQEANAEMRELLPYFYGGTVTKAKKFSSVYDDKAEVVVKGTDGAVGSELTSSNGKEYSVFVNLSLTDNMTLSYYSDEYSVLPGGMVLIEH